VTIFSGFVIFEKEATLSGIREKIRRNTCVVKTVKEFCYPKKGLSIL
jgi:hypothetical protein